MNQQGDHGAESYFDYNEYLPDACQINLDYAGECGTWGIWNSYSYCTC